MNQPDLLLIKKLLENAPFSFAEIRLSVSKSNSISLSGKNIDSVSSGSTCGGSIRLLENGNWFFVSFNDFTNIRKYFENAVSLSKTQIKNSGTKIIPSKEIHLNHATKFERDVHKVSFDEKFSLLKSYNDILLDHEKIQTSRAYYRDLKSVNYYFNSEGTDIVYDKSFCGVSLSSIAKDGNDTQPYHSSSAGYGGFELVSGKELLAQEVVKTAVNMLKAEEIQGGRYDLVTDQRLAGVFIHEAFGHLSEADFVHENRQMKEIMKIGTIFGPEDLNVIDDGTIDSAGFIPCDDEGILPRKNYLIREGKLSGRLHSRETAAIMDEEPTGNARAISSTVQPIVRMTNTYIDGGKYSPEEIISSVENGIYAVDYHGGMTSLEMFTFSPSYGYLIKNGKKTKMIKNIMFSGNVFETIKSISKIGNDVQLFGGLGGCGKGGQSPLTVSLGGPHLLIKDVLVGGKQ